MFNLTTRPIVAFYGGVLLASLFLNCRQDQEQKQAALPANPDGVTRVRISQFFMDTQDSLVYNLTEDSITVVWHHYRYDNDKHPLNSVVFGRKLTPAQRFSALGKIDFMKRSYHNACIADGLTLLVEYWGRQGRKQVYLTNYYLPLVDQTVKLINAALPVERQLRYDKDELMKQLKDCNRIDVNEPPNGYPYPSPPPPFDLSDKDSKKT